MKTIREFAKLCGTTEKTLRYYDRMGILRPAYTDPENGYRYYREDQSHTFRMIRWYKSMGFTISEIRRIWKGDSEKVGEMVQRKKESLQAALKECEEWIEWRKKFSGKGRIVFCGGDGFTLHERPSGVRSGQPFSYTAYLVGGRFGELAAENALVMDELHPEVRAWLDATRKILKEHFRQRAASAAAERLAKWIAEKSYPFAADDDSPARAKFDAGVADMRANLEGFDALPTAERAYLFQLLLRAVGGDSQTLNLKPGT